MPNQTEAQILRRIEELEDGSGGGGGGPWTADDIDSESATDGHVLTADGSGGAAWEAGGGGSGTPLTIRAKVQVAEESLDGTETYIDFSSIDQTGVHLFVEADIESTTGANSTSLDMYVNADYEDSNYNRQHNYVDNGNHSTSEAVLPRAAFMLGADGKARGRIDIVIPYYTETREKMYVSDFWFKELNGDMFQGRIAMSHKTDTAAITGLRIEAGAGNITGEVRLFIEKDIDVLT